MNEITKTIKATNAQGERVTLTFKWGKELKILGVRNVNNELVSYTDEDFQGFYDDIVDSLS